MDPQQVSSDKAELRTALLRARRLLVEARDRDRDDVTLARHALDLATSSGLGAGDTVAAYEAMRSEPPMGATVRALAAAGIRVIVPVTLPDLDLDWCDATDARRMPLGPDTISSAALVLVPGLAADTTGTRLGRGGGSYDRALLRRRPGSRVLLVLHPGELREEPLPADAHDQRVDGVLTVDGVSWT